MKNTGTCPKCAATVVIGPARLETAPPGFDTRPHEPLQLAVDGDPCAVLLKETKRSGLGAYVCSQCGYIELYAKDVAPLLKAYEKAQGNQNT